VPPTQPSATQEPLQCTRTCLSPADR
jgi:hypothetical protein